MKDGEFVRTTIDRCLFIRRKIINGESCICLAILYVDDIMFLGEPSMATKSSDQFCEYYPTTEGGDSYLGLETRLDKLTGELHVSQTAYIDKIARVYGIHDMHPRFTPLPPKWNPLTATVPPTAEAFPDIDLRQGIGYVMYAVRTRPEIAHAVNSLATVATPS